MKAKIPSQQRKEESHHINLAKKGVKIGHQGDKQDIEKKKDLYSWSYEITLTPEDLNLKAAQRRDATILKFEDPQ